MNTNDRELEIKILEVDNKELESKIYKLWWLKTRDEIFEAIWMKNVNGKKVRVRKEWKDTSVEFKKKISGSWNIKESIEVWYHSDNFEKQIEVLELLWFIQISRSIKNRISYCLEKNNQHEKVILDFDTYSNFEWLKIPQLLEIEAQSKKTIIKVAKLLGFEEFDFKNWWADELLEYYKNI